MKELLRTHDPVLLSWVTAYLKDAGIETMLFDEHTGILQGSITAIEKRLMVADDNFEMAKTLLKECDEYND